jgi:hypothetical protein
MKQCQDGSHIAWARRAVLLAALAQVACYAPGEQEAYSDDGTGLQQDGQSTACLAAFSGEVDCMACNSRCTSDAGGCQKGAWGYAFDLNRKVVQVAHRQAGGSDTWRVEWTKAASAGPSSSASGGQVWNVESTGKLEMRLEVGGTCASPIVTARYTHTSTDPEPEGSTVSGSWNVKAEALCSNKVTLAALNVACPTN